MRHHGLGSAEGGWNREKDRGYELGFGSNVAKTWVTIWNWSSGEVRIIVAGQIYAHEYR